MNKIIFIFIVLIPLKGLAQVEYKCNQDLCLIANQNADNLTEKICLDFLMTIDSTCENDVEFSEFSNGTLYKLLEKNPLLVITTIDKYKKTIHLDLIFSMIQDPIDDSIDLIRIKSKIEKLNYQSINKLKIIKYIEIAISHGDYN